jgi:hypothetical protein
MARRRQTIGGDEGDDIVDAYTQAYFKRGQQEDPRMAMAMQLLGLQEKSQQASEARAQEERQQQALERYQQGQLGIERERVGVSKSEAEANALARAAEADFRAQQAARGEQLTREAGVREAEKARLEHEDKLRGQKSEAIRYAVAQQYMTPEEGIAQIHALDPEMQRVAEGVKEKALGEKVAANLERYRAMKPEARQALAANPAEMLTVGGPEGYRRILQQLGEQPSVAGAAAPKGPNISVANLLWNTPGGLENIFRGIANVGGRAIYGRDVPQYSYVPWTEVNVAGGGGPSTPVGPPPETPLQPGLGGYGPMVPQEAVPEWQYGVGTRRPPPPPVDDILARARLGQ